MATPYSRGGYGGGERRFPIRVLDGVSVAGIHHLVFSFLGLPKEGAQTLRTVFK